MEFEIRPEPSPEEREAVVAALERLLARDPVPAAYRSRWRDEAVRENVDADYATARPRSSPGATRA
jgi:hypothetical protein